MRRYADLPAWARKTIPVIVVWDLFWRSLALLRAARRRQPVWFLCLLVLSTGGVLPIVYLLLDGRRAAAES
jgi:hypothetical protein